MQLPILSQVPGGDTVTSLKLGAGNEDVRTIVSYSASPHAAVDQSATHSHVDELAHMPEPKRTWSSIQTTVAPGGSCHVVTRGAGDDNFAAELWRAAESDESMLVPLFAPWSERPDRDRAWREQQAASLPLQGMLHFAPETPDDALAGDETAEYLPAEVWDRCFDPSLPPLVPGDRTPLVVGVDAAVTGDTFAIVAVSRHPTRNADPAIRACKLWTPAGSGGRIDLIEAERFLRSLVVGGCPGGHPREMPNEVCPSCIQGDFSMPAHNVVQIAYDPYQMEGMAQRLRQGGKMWVKEFGQTHARLVADSAMHKLALTGRLAHDGDPRLREHVLNVRVQLSKNEDSKMRMVKKGPSRHIDLAVAASMAIDRALYLNI